MSQPRDRNLAAAVDLAFDYRGYVTVSRQDGTTLVGFVYDRGPGYLEMFDDTATQRIRVALSDVAHIEFTGEDSAAKAQRIWERRKGALEPRETSAWGDWGERPILFVVALPQELHGVAAALGARAHGAAVRGRIHGATAVAVAVGVGGGAAHVIAAEAPRLVVSCGLSGALDPTLATGDWVLASAVHDETGETVFAPELVLRAARRALGRGPHAGGRRLVEGEILCATAVAATQAEKRKLARPGRLAIDLESGAVARAAARAEIPWLALRVILDPVDLALPAFTRRPARSYAVPALRHALGGPRAITELVGLARRARIATRSLADAIRRLAPVLGGVHPERTS